MTRSASLYHTVLLLFATVLAAGVADAAEKPNVLFIAVDDLRPELNCYGADYIHSPNIDKLAASGVLFQRAYCMVPTCGASRASLMSGIRPASDRFVSFTARVDHDAPDVVTLNTHFKNNGYHTVSLGKIFHFPEDNAHGWSEPPWRRTEGTVRYALEENARKEPGYKNGAPFESADVADERYGDGALAVRAVADLRRLSEQDEPFFLAVGFWKPHLPFVAPKRYWDLYDPDSIKVPDNYWPPEGAPEGAVHTSGELRGYTGIPKRGLVDEEMARNLIRGYYACVSYIDAQVGKVLDELHRLGIEDDTIVMLWGDHGWNLGEHSMWCKHSCFEVSMRPAFIVRAPGYASGAETMALTEYIDIYPTLCDLAGLPKPAHLDGESFVPVLKDPATHVKTWAIGRFKAGDTLRTSTHRYSFYRDAAGEFTGRMLYDHRSDPAENRNLSELPERAPLVDSLHDTLTEHMGKPF